MALTQDDLVAIKGIVEDATEKLAVQTAAGFAEVDEKFGKVDEALSQMNAELKRVGGKLDAQDGKLENAVQRVDQHSLDIDRLKKVTNLA